jgi:hypothetical protein
MVWILDANILILLLPLSHETKIMKEWYSTVVSWMPNVYSLRSKIYSLHFKINVHLAFKFYPIKRVLWIVVKFIKLK